MTSPTRRVLLCLMVASCLSAAVAIASASPLSVVAALNRAGLEPGEILRRGESLTSPDGRTKLVFHHNGALALYHGGARQWSGGAAGAGGDLLIMQHDGDLVMYMSRGLLPIPVWSSDSGGFPGAALSVRDEGGAVIRRDGEPILWSGGLPAPDVGLEGVPHIIYGRGDQMVWLVEADGTLTDSYQVSGRADSPAAGRYEVFSKSRHTRSRDGSLRMEYMVRFVKRAPGRSIGFHSIPVTLAGAPVQTEEELGLYRSAGCVRQSDGKAEQLYNWADVGIPVVVLA